MRLHVVDGTYELFRAYFSKRPSHVGPDGRDMKATVGLAASMLALLHEVAEGVSHVAVAFDNPIQSIRNDWFDGYKTDEGVPADLLSQFDDAETAIRALGVVVWSMDRYEADDALATAASRWGDDVEQVRILTPDKDLGQSIRGQRVVQVDRMRRRVTDEEEFMVRFGIRPESLPDWLALVGDTADGIPGLPGFGEKTASALLREYVHLESIPSSSAAWPARIQGAPRLAVTFAREIDAAILYRKLATLMTDVPLPQNLGDLGWSGVPRRPFQEWCESLGVTDLLERPQRWRD